MAAFVALDLGQTDESEREEEFVAGPPKSKKKRGANAEYLYLEDTESLDDLKFKAKAAGLKMKSIGDGTAYYICKYAPCSYKWKANVTEDYKYVIKRTESDHDHAEHTQKKGLSKEAKKIIDKRIHDNDRVNAGAVLNAFRNDENIRNYPTTIQVNNYVSHHKKIMGATNADINFADVEKMVTEMLQEQSELVEFKYVIDEYDPSNTHFAMIFTCKKLMDDQRSQKHAQIDATFKLIYKNFPVIVWGYSDVNRHIHPTGVAVISSETIAVYKWVFQFLKSNDYCEGVWEPSEVRGRRRGHTAALVID